MMYGTPFFYIGSAEVVLQNNRFDASSKVQQSCSKIYLSPKRENPFKPVYKLQDEKELHRSISSHFLLNNIDGRL